MRKIVLVAVLLIGWSTACNAEMPTVGQPSDDLTDEQIVTARRHQLQLYWLVMKEVTALHKQGRHKEADLLRLEYIYKRLRATQKLS